MNKFTQIHSTACVVFHQMGSLVGGFNPFEKYYCSHSGSFPRVGMKIENN